MLLELKLKLEEMLGDSNNKDTLTGLERLFAQLQLAKENERLAKLTL